MIHPARRPARIRAALVGTLFLIVWLFLAAVPALADGGPHVASVNSGVSSLTADSCAGCHRAHTAQGAMLLKVPEEELCLSCHGDAVAGATTDVMSGIQYALGTDGLRNDAAVLGALRGGGFDQARIASGTPARIFQSGAATSVWAKVSVGGAADVTSAHLNLVENGLSAPGKAWGNGAVGSGAGPTVSIGCGSCHNPHGNGQYRILNPIPAPAATTAGTFVPVAAPGAAVSDAGLPAANDARNYTVIQTRGTIGTPSTFLLYASQVVSGGFSNTDGDYWHLRVPWNSSTGTADTPNGLTGFNDQMDTWCSACHTRYHGNPSDPIDPTGDSVFQFRHQTGGRTTCTTCHVSHGSNARMDGPYSVTIPFPDGTAVSYDIGGTTGDSRLLKVNNRGTCQLCHDPTGTVLPGTYTGPATVPGVP